MEIQEVKEKKIVIKYVIHFSNSCRKCIGSIHTFQKFVHNWNWCNYSMLCY